MLVSEFLEQVSGLNLLRVCPVAHLLLQHWCMHAKRAGQAAPGVDVLE